MLCYVYSMKNCEANEIIKIKIKTELTKKKLLKERHRGREWEQSI